MNRATLHEPRKRPKQRRSQITVDAILEATARVLVHEGYEKASTNRIAKVAGVSIGSLYQYFPSKESLVLALIEHHCEDMLKLLVESSVKLASAPLDQAIRTYVKAMLAAHDVLRNERYGFRRLTDRVDYRTLKPGTICTARILPARGRRCCDTRRL